MLQNDLKCWRCHYKIFQFYKRSSLRLVAGLSTRTRVALLTDQFLHEWNIWRYMHIASIIMFSTKHRKHSKPTNQQISHSDPAFLSSHSCVGQSRGWQLHRTQHFPWNQYRSPDRSWIVRRTCWSRKESRNSSGSTISSELCSTCSLSQSRSWSPFCCYVE